MQLLEEFQLHKKLCGIYGNPLYIYFMYKLEVSITNLVRQSV